MLIKKKPTNIFFQSPVKLFEHHIKSPCKQAEIPQLQQRWSGCCGRSVSEPSGQWRGSPNNAQIKFPQLLIKAEYSHNYN